VNFLKIISNWQFPVTIIFAGFLALFLYFRSGRRELFARETLFDFVFVAILGALVFGRLFDFLIRADFYGWSFRKLVFFNAYSGFDIWGALSGGILAGALFLRRSNPGKFWVVFDLLAAPVSLAASLVSLVLFFSNQKLIYLFLGIGYFIIFWLLKRIEKIKRHPGFFISFFVVFVSILNLVLYPAKTEGRLLFGLVSYNLLLPSFYLVIFAILWLFLSKRKVQNDFKWFFAQLLLLIFKLKEMLTSVNDANRLAKTIIMLPLSISKSIYYLVLLVGREIYASILDFVKALGITK